MVAAVTLRPPWCPVPPAPPHTTISQHAVRQVYVVKTKEYICFYYLLAILKARRNVDRRSTGKLINFPPP